MLSQQVLDRRKWRTGLYDKLLTSSILRVLPDYITPDRLTIDVGGNSGYQTYFHAKYNNVVTYEPVPELFKILQSNLKGIDNVTLVNKAVTDKNKDVELFVDVNRLSMTSQMPLVESEAVKVSGVALDNENHVNVGFIKVDVEGYELDVLKGATKLIERDRPTMMVEVYQPWCDKIGFSSETIFEFFVDRDYRILYYDCEQTKMVECGEAGFTDVAQAIDAVHNLHHLHDGDFLFVAN
jgi:FkbM family methyltransferase